MRNIPCPHCEQTIAVPPNANSDDIVSCPSCAMLVVLLSIDIDFFGTGSCEFPILKWTPVDDGRTSAKHLELAKRGIQGTAYFRVDDPIFAWYFTAMRKGLWLCRCHAGFVSHYKVQRKQIPIEFAKPLDFDPWSPWNECGLMCWSTMPPPMYLVETRKGTYKGDFRLTGRDREAL
jgi:hypothetical protein